MKYILLFGIGLLFSCGSGSNADHSVDISIDTWILDNQELKSALSDYIRALDNTMYFGDPMMTGKQYLTGIVAGGLIGGGVNGITALANGRTFMSGTIKPPPTSTVRPSLPSLNSSKPEVNIEGMKAEIRRESIVFENTTVPEPLQPGPIRVNMGNELRYVDASGGGETFFEGTKYSLKVLGQMDKADDMFHAFPKSVDGFANEFGKVSTILGGDGKIYQLLRVQGSYGGKMGIFEYIKNPLTGEINHRFFNVP